MDQTHQTMVFLEPQYHFNYNYYRERDEWENGDVKLVVSGIVNCYMFFVNNLQVDWK